MLDRQGGKIRNARKEAGVPFVRPEPVRAPRMPACPSPDAPQYGLWVKCTLQTASKLPFIG